LALNALNESCRSNIMIPIKIAIEVH
jgi:hypothetical protein